MSKKFKGKTCVYCGGVSTEPDHVFAREFFLTADRAALPKVPVCRDCNSSKSDLEHYVVSVAPFGARHVSAKENLETMVPKRLARNAPLLRSLAAHHHRVWADDEFGLLVPHMTLPIDHTRMSELFVFIAKGLLWYHWQVRLLETDSVSVTMLTAAGERLFDERFFNVPVGDRVSADLGNGTVRYDGVQAVDMPQLSVWRVRMLGGVRFGDSALGATSSMVGLITGPGEVVDTEQPIEAHDQ
jgi:hypothetical protein